MNSLVNGIEFTGNVIKTEGMKQVETLIKLKPTLKFLILKEANIFLMSYQLWLGLNKKRI